MISFIIIGRNEEKTIKACITSVIKAIEHNNYRNAEIIYVDSKSTDNTLNIVKKFDNIKIYEIIGVHNAAIARNIGAKEAKGDILCFIDGDMELQKKFLQIVIKNGKLIYPFISGQLQNIFYNNYKEWKLVGTNFLHNKLNNDRYEVTTGGYFLIEHRLWDSVKGMNTKYRRSQDLDLGLRLAKKGIKILRKKELMVKHHTVDYQNRERIWKMLFDGSLLYQTSVLYRDHIFNKHIYRMMLRKDYTLLILILTLLLFFYNVWILVIFPTSVFIRVNIVNKKKNTDTNFIEKFFYRLLNDVLSLFGFIVFFPKKHSLNYKKMNNF